MNRDFADMLAVLSAPGVEFLVAFSLVGGTRQAAEGPRRPRVAQEADEVGDCLKTYRLEAYTTVPPLQIKENLVV